jgi:hypothetical protein
MTNTPFIRRCSEGAAAITLVAPGQAHPDYVDLAEHVLAHLVNYAQPSIPGIYQQDLDYLSRMFEALARLASA